MLSIFAAYHYFMNYLIYLVHGSADYFNEALYSVLSAIKTGIHRECHIVIYTTDEAFFTKWLPVDTEYVEITPAQLQEWMGEIQFNHRAKIKVLQDACQRFPGNLLYSDTDTKFRQPLAPLFRGIEEGKIYFHTNEGQLANTTGGIAKKLRKFFTEHNRFYIPSLNETVQIDDSLTVFNCGFVGFKSNYSQHLKFAEELTDAMYSKYRLFVMEQVALNYVLQQASVAEDAAAYAEHYWYFKEFRGVLKAFFEHHKGKDINAIINALDTIDPYALSAEKRAYKKMGFFEKQWKKLRTGAKWKVPVFNP